MLKAVRAGAKFLQRELYYKFNYSTSFGAYSHTSAPSSQSHICQQSSVTAGAARDSALSGVKHTLTMPEEQQPKIVFVLGGPGAGKGTQCSRIVDRFQFVHLSAGDLLREERAREGSQYGSLIEDYIRNGKIVPVEVTCSLIEQAMKSSGKNKFLIDGFPRNQDNLDGWARTMADKVDFRFVLFFNCSEELCVERCLQRGQSGSGRSDDNMESLKKRIQTYNNDSMPIIKHFEQLGQVKQIDASPNAEQVFEKVEKIFMESGFK